MKAVAYQKPLPIADAQSLQDVDLPEPVPGERDLLVDVKAVSVNPVDVKVRRRSQPPEGQWSVLGWDAVGIVRTVGENVTLFKPGDRVWYAGAINRPGANAERSFNSEPLLVHLTNTTASPLACSHAPIVKLAARETGETRMLRRTLIAAAWGQAGVLMVLPGLAQTGVRRIAYVWLFSSGPSAPYPAEFRNRLRELGWIEGKSVEIVQYDAEGSPEKLAAIMKRLVDEKVDVIVGTCTPEAKAAVKATQTIPIVMAATGDPVGAGLAQSFARPGGNVTGVSGMGLDLSAKRLEILKTSFPNVARATVVFNPERPDNLPEVRAMQAAGLTVGVKVDTLEVRTPTELNDGLDLLPSSTQALLNAGDSLLGSQAPRVIAEAARRRIPALYEDRDYVDRGGLMSYGPSIGRLHRRAADYVDRILKGASPAELPIEQPTSFELVINLKTAKALGLPIPRAVLLRANEIIQ